MADVCAGVWWCGSVGLTERDPRVVCVTCVLIACKVEEWQLNAKALIKEMQRGGETASSPSSSLDSSQLPPPPFPPFPYSVADVLDCELDVLHRLTFDLIVFHPYRPLLHFLSDFTAHPSYPSLLQHSWWLVNDLYYTDLILLFPPYLLACACTYVACHLLGVEYRVWLKQLTHINTAALLDIAQQLLAYHDKRTQQQQQGAAYHATLNTALQALHSHFEGKGGGAGGATTEGTEAVGEGTAGVGEEEKSAEVSMAVEEEKEKQKVAPEQGEEQPQLQPPSQDGGQDDVSMARKKQKI